MKKIKKIADKLGCFGLTLSVSSIVAVLKISGVVSVSWWWVFSPVLLIVFVAIVLFSIGMYELTKALAKEKNGLD